MKGTLKIRPIGMWTPSKCVCAMFYIVKAVEPDTKYMYTFNNQVGPTVL